MLARYYEAGVGRFLSVDPGADNERGAPQSWNAYVYVRNDPISATDPTGKFSDWILTKEFAVKPEAAASSGSGGAAMRSGIESVAHETSAAASTIGVGALLAAGAAALKPGARAAVVPLLGVAGTMGTISTGADVGAAIANPSQNNLATAGGDLISIGAGAAALQGTQSQLTPVGRVAAEAVTIPAAAAGAALLDQAVAAITGSDGGVTAPAPRPTPTSQPAQENSPPNTEKKK
jgi:uncharacterized protein RhaS with RHS repeats